MIRQLFQPLRRRVLFVGTAGVFAAAAASLLVAGKNAPDATAGVAVVELFTSEGCSSCPPAERVLGRLQDAARGGRPVMTLAFHVDYWDRLGWKDRFSDAAWTARQRDYATAFGADGVYTPQMVVNGRSEFVGSNRRKAEAAVKDALARPVEVPVTKLQVDRDGDAYRVRFSVPAAERGMVLNLAVVEEGLQTRVERGENAGRTIDEPSVVRSFTTVPAEVSGEAKLTLPAGVKAGRASVVAYVQRPGKGPVLGAATTPLE